MKDDEVRIIYWDDDCQRHDEIMAWSQVKDLYPEKFLPYFKIRKITPSPN
jgi:hypothetical protein